MERSEDLWEVLREAGYEPTDESRRHARERLERAHVDADARIECRERMEEIMARPS
jgi:hypothetical protein